MRKPIVVVEGSLNCDIIAKGDNLPKLGETVIGRSHTLYSGGKGANQAVQLAKLGAEVYLIGRIGHDSYGDLILDSLHSAGVHTDFLKREDEATGLGLVQCGAGGQYYAMVIPGANGCCRAADVLEAKEIIAKADVVLCQLEATDEALYEVADLADTFSVPLILNPAPAKEIDGRLFSLTHTLTPNETEAAFYAQMNPEELNSSEGLALAAERILSKGAGRLLITLGGRGCFYADRNRQFTVPAVPVKAVDTTAAGDAFNGAYAYAVACGQSPAECLLFANAAGAVAASKSGAQSSMGGTAEIKELIKDRT